MTNKYFLNFYVFLLHLMNSFLKDVSFTQCPGKMTDGKNYLTLLSTIRGHPNSTAIHEVSR